MTKVADYSENNKHRIPVPKDGATPVQIKAIRQNSGYSHKIGVPNPMKCSKCNYVADTKMGFNRHWQEEH